VGGRVWRAAGAEFRRDSTFCAQPRHGPGGAVAGAGEANVGVNLDVFHYYTGPSKFEDLDLLTPQTLAFVRCATWRECRANWPAMPTACCRAMATFVSDRCWTGCRDRV
jgi:hypothetical protein